MMKRSIPKILTKEQFMRKIGEECYVNNSDGTAIGSTSGLDLFGRGPYFLATRTQKLADYSTSLDKNWLFYSQVVDKK